MNEVSAQSSRRRLSGHAVGIPPRHIDFNFTTDTPRYFYANNATATLFFAMLSGFFPPGERYFMESVRHFRERITDERLRAAIAGFMGQEAIHGREHDLFNALLAARGFDMATPERTVTAGLKLLGYYNGPVDAVFGPGTRAAIRAYQGDLSHPVTGILTSAEAAKLTAGTPGP